MAVSAIVLNWNGASVLPDALSSLNDQTASNLEIIVVDNGSSDQSEKVAYEYGARFVPLGRNLGFATGNNFGAKNAAGEFLFFVNNDMKFAAGCVDSLVQMLEEHHDSFAADCVQLQWGTRRLVHAGTIIQRGSWDNNLPFIDVNPIGIEDCFTAVPWTCAGNSMVRKSMFVELGGFDPVFFANAEDVDLCLRAWAKGWPSFFVPPGPWDNEVEHHVGFTTERTRDWRLARTPGNYLRFMSKTYGRELLIRATSAYAARVGFSLLTGDWRTAGGTTIGALWYATLLRDTLSWRRRTLGTQRYRVDDVLDVFMNADGPTQPDQIIATLESRGRDEPGPRRVSEMKRMSK